MCVEEGEREGERRDGGRREREIKEERGKEMGREREKEGGEEIPLRPCINQKQSVTSLSVLCGSFFFFF